MVWAASLLRVAWYLQSIRKTTDMNKRLLIFIGIVFLTITSCKTQYEMMLDGNDIAAKYKTGFDLFNEGKYLKAADMFESLSMQTSGLSMDDTVKFYWGYSHYKFGDFITAEENFGDFIDSYPDSPFTLRAKFLRIDCLYNCTYRYELDQTPTYKALSEIEKYLKENVGSEEYDKVLEMQKDLRERLELKAYKSAYLYYHMEDYMAAHYALKNVLKQNAENHYREEILYYTAMSAYKYASLSVPDKQKERYLTFVDDYFNVISEFPESGFRKELDKLYEKVQKLQILKTEDE